MVMTEARLHGADVHDRIPVVLRREDWGDWLGGPRDEAGLLCRPYPGGMVVERNGEPSLRRRSECSAIRRDAHIDTLDPTDTILSRSLWQTRN